MSKKVDEYDDYDRWVVRCTDRFGNSGWYGEGRRRIPTCIKTRGSAYRFSSELHAREAGYKAQERGDINPDFVVEELPERPVFKKTADGREGHT